MPQKSSVLKRNALEQLYTQPKAPELVLYLTQMPWNCTILNQNAIQQLYTWNMPLRMTLAQLITKPNFLSSVLNLSTLEQL